MYVPYYRMQWSATFYIGSGVLLTVPVFEFYEMVVTLYQCVVFDRVYQPTVRVYDIGAFIDFYHCVEQFVYSLSACGYRGDYRYSYQLAESIYIELIAPMLKLVVEVKGYNAPQIHIYQLCGKVHITFKIARIENV